MALSHKNFKPYQGLKLLRYLLRYCKPSQKNLNPYQGLKPSTLDSV
jgi:hypothetical protein